MPAKGRMTRVEAQHWHLITPIDFTVHANALDVINTTAAHSLHFKKSLKHNSWSQTWAKNVFEIKSSVYLNLERSKTHSTSHLLRSAWTSRSSSSSTSRVWKVGRAWRTCSCGESAACACRRRATRNAWQPNAPPPPLEKKNKTEN